MDSSSEQQESGVEIKIKSDEIDSEKGSAKDEGEMNTEHQSDVPDNKEQDPETQDKEKQVTETQDEEKPVHVPTPPSGSKPATPSTSRPGSRTGQRSGAEDQNLTTERPKSGESRPRSGASGEVSFEAKQRGKKAPIPADAHTVRFTITIAQAVPTQELEWESSQNDAASSVTAKSRASSASTSKVENEDQQDISELVKKKKRIVEAPRAQNFYHCEYNVMPDDEDPVKTDMVTFGIAAKIYPENVGDKVLKTWQDGDQTWVAWTQRHTVHLTKESLLKLFKHTLELRIWDTKDKLMMRARYDRPKSFKLPQARPGTSADEIGGVKALVMKQCKFYLKMQPKRLYLSRPLPSQVSTVITEAKDLHGKPVIAKKEKAKTPKKPVQNVTKDVPPEEPPLPQPPLPLPRELVSSGVGQRPGTEMSTPHTLVSLPTGKDKVDMKSYERLGKLAGVEPPNIAKEMKKQLAQEYATRSQSPKKPDTQAPEPGVAPVAAPAPVPVPPTVTLLPPGVSNSDTGASPRSVNKSIGSESESTAMYAQVPKRERGRRSKKSEAAAQAAIEHVKKYGIACIPIRMALLFSGMKSVTNRLEKPVPGIDDLFLTVSVDGPLMSEEQRQALNPMIIKVHSATNMPETPMNIEQLQQTCEPAYVKYKFYKQPEHISMGREHGTSIYWDDVDVVLLGTIEPSELREYLNGPPLEMEVHDRDRIMEKEKLKASLFGDDLEDEKINSVGAVSGRRTLHNPLKGKPRPWDPYGLAKLNLSDFLLGERVINLKVPIHNCPVPDILGVRNPTDDTSIGLQGAVDGPVDSPLPVGHYIDSNAMLKVRFEVAYPLTTPNKLAAKAELDTTFECPFGRIIFMFDFKNIRFLQRLQSLVKDINAQALELENMPQHVIDAALSTYKLSVEQQHSRELDIVTGFQMMDGIMHIFVLEGLREKAIKLLWEELPKPENSDIEVLYNSDLAFRERMYGPLDVDLCRVKLHEPLSVIVQQPLLYVRDMVPRPCFEALVKLEELSKTKKLRNVVRNDLFPTAEMVVSMSREFGVPLTAEDFEELEPPTSPSHFVESQEQLVDTRPHTSRPWTPLDIRNKRYEEHLEERDTVGQTKDFIKENVSFTKRISEINRIDNYYKRPITVKADVNVAHNYSTQSLNSTELAKEKLRQELAKYPDHRFTYNPEYNHSMTVVPVNVEAVRKQEEEQSKAEWKTMKGWTYPGVDNLRRCNMHPKRPDVARVDALTEYWRENTLHSNKLEPTLSEREIYTWSKRNTDMDLWTKPPHVFGVKEPVTIHLAGDALKHEQRQASRSAHEMWRSKIVVEDPRVYFHRCNTITEQIDKGQKSSNQIAKLQSLLKDEPKKLSFKKEADVPPLNVVLNPSVDTISRTAGFPLRPAIDNEFDQPVKGFMAGPYTEFGWHLERNKIPIRDYDHKTFIAKKGHDFNVYHKERSVLSQRKLVPLTASERDVNLFNMPQPVYEPRTVAIPEMGYRSFPLPRSYTGSLTGSQLNLESELTALSKSATVDGKKRVVKIESN